MSRSRIARTGRSGDVNDKLYLGIDPGLNRTGYALLRRSATGPILCEAGVVRSAASDALARRVHEIAQGLREVVEEFQPSVAAVEQVFSFRRNPRTALRMAHARGGILMTLHDLHVPIVHYTPTEIKRLLTGSGRASKQQIQHAVRNELRLAEVPEPNDVADASAVALCVYHHIGFAA